MSKLVKMFRFSSFCHRNKLKILAGLTTRLIRFVFSCDIPSATKIGDGTVFAHNGLGCVVNEYAVIGKNCKISQNVTIGGRGPGSGTPIIGDNVLIGAGACILGGVKIGNYAKIGANAVVVNDVPENATVVGIPAKQIIIS